MSIKLPEAIAIALISLVGVIVGAFVTPLVDYGLRSREMDNKMVELAIDVLKSNCRTEPGLVPARKWAVEVIDHYSSVKLEADAKSALIDHSIGQRAFSAGFSKDFQVEAHSPCT